MKSLMHRALAIVYPDQCLLCDALIDAHAALCAACWSQVAFLRGTVCDRCGAGLPGEGSKLVCDDCIVIERPWSRGRAALVYDGGGRRIVLGLKHGDRSDLIGPAAGWMAAAGADILSKNTVLVPVPLHWTRLTRRLFNQSADLARAIGTKAGLEAMPDALRRVRATQKQDGMSVDARFANLCDAIVARDARLSGRNVCLVDDVMTSGATLSAATIACHDAGATRVDVLVLARVAKSP